MTADLQTDETIIEENVAYVLGMYDLYRNDNEIRNMLVMKGLDLLLINQILYRIKLPAYEKRLKQSKRIIINSASLILSFISLYLLLNNLPGADTLLKGKRDEEGVLIVVFKFYKEIGYLFFFGTVLSLIIGIGNYKKYSKLLKLEKE